MGISEQVTYGDLLGAIISAFVALCVFGVSVRRYLLRRYPFNLRVSDQPSINPPPESDLKSKLSLPLGVSENLWFKVRLREGRELQVIDLRFVTRSWSLWPIWAPVKYCDAPKDAVIIIDMKYKDSSTYADSVPDLAGGREIEFGFTRNLPEDAVIFLNVSIEAKKHFRGFISFEQKRGDKNRAYGRRRATLGNPKTWLERLGDPVNIRWEPDRREWL
jgi:hypothetical protein